MLKLFDSTVIENKPVGKNLYLMKIQTPDGIVSSPGQFLSLLVPDKTFRRPISILNNHSGVMELLYKIKGDGTKYFSTLKSGESINFTGVHGNSFKVGKRNLLIGAGVGMAPVYYMYSMLKEQNIPALLACGFREEGEIPVCFKSEFDFISTDDGSYSNKGSIVNYVENLINNFKPDNICVCGPVIVMKLISEIAQKHNIFCQVSMEKMMACSIGACRGCVIKIKDNGVIKNSAVCKEGTVYDSRVVFYDLVEGGEDA